ncbi:MAG: glycoside hydrolase family 2 protein [Candidatus Bacteroides intestinipullorum]|uniref:Glycoside hydrolase family 2 protein n=1 Tax=Candidatus Bacteroides intestinipullorum TaxID=2838471 RepID=A0A9E2KIH5_9BACE|nr:glycoside hydrolase family 2 protein [Candidatus Bacteroides intestinipullorum]
MKQILPIALLCLAGAFTSLSAQQQRLLDDGWQFQRLETAAPTGEIRNQGSDWASQFNVEHVQSTPQQGLAVPADTLRREFALLERGTWETVSLPHTPFVEPLVVLHQWQGICYYRRRFSLQPEEAGKRLWLDFEGAMHLADVWVNGQHLAQHLGGYTPFAVDVTDVVRTDRPNEVLVRLDNRNNPLIPPGKPLETLDFCYYGGLYRDVRLVAKPAVHITDPVMARHTAGGGIFVTYPEADEREALIHIATEVANTTSKTRKPTLRHTLYEWDRQTGRGRRVADVEGSLKLAAGDTATWQADIRLENPRLWSPDSPALYVLETEVDGDKEGRDLRETRIGIRRLEMSREKGFLINGRPLRLVGTNRHMEYPYVGNALSDNAQYRDIYQIKANGFNVVRLGHYPQDPSVLDACDELGLLAIEPIPGWQFFNKDSVFIRHTYQDVRDLIRRDRNHPSIILWETTLNESWPPKEWKDGAVRVAHEEYPGDQCFTSGDSYGYDGFDVCYNDWEEGFNRPNHTRKPGFIREYYDYEFGGHYSTTRIRRGDGDRALRQNVWNAQWSLNRYNPYYPATMGAAVWSMYDYNRGCCDNICYSGVADVFRLPKFSLPFFRTQVKAGAVLLPDVRMPHEVFVATHWLEGSSDTVQVFGNVDEVELRLNGRTVARRCPDNGPDSPYVSAPDGGNCRNLDCPPFTFTGVKWEAGTLEAVDYKEGREVARHAVKTPGEVSALQISYFESGKPAAKNDLLIVYVSLVDKDSTLAFGENRREVTLHTQKTWTLE